VRGCQLFVCEPLSAYLLDDFQEPGKVRSSALVEPERLFVNVARKMLRFGLDVRSVNDPVEQAPEVLNTVGADVRFGVLDGVVNERVNVAIFESAITSVRVGVVPMKMRNGFCSMSASGMLWST
jgi:hypothetical protein